MNAYNTPRLIVIHRGILTDNFIFRFQMMVAGKMASAASVNEFIAKYCEYGRSRTSSSIAYMLGKTRDVRGRKVESI